MAAILGRERELAALDAFPTTGQAARALVLAGDPGIGKSTLWEGAVAAWRRSGLRVLAARPSGADAQLAFSGLIDLLDGIELDELSAVPAPQLRALEVAL